MQEKYAIKTAKCDANKREVSLQKVGIIEN